MVRIGRVVHLVPLWIDRNRRLSHTREHTLTVCDPSLSQISNAYVFFMHKCGRLLNISNVSMIEFQNTERRYDNLHDTDNMTYIGRSGQTSVNVLGSLFYEFVPHRAYPRFAEDSADH